MRSLHQIHSAPDTFKAFVSTNVSYTYLVCSCCKEFGSETKKRTLKLKKNGEEPVGERESEREKARDYNSFCILTSSHSKVHKYCNVSSLYVNTNTIVL